MHQKSIQLPKYFPHRKLLLYSRSLKQRTVNNCILKPLLCRNEQKLKGENKRTKIALRYKVQKNTKAQDI